jgi:8-amino-7-oxononanoate synthase
LLSASGSRPQFGNYDYLLQVEKEIAEFHNAETAWVAHSGFFACAGVIEAVLLPEDAIVYDELMHSSTHIGMKISREAHRLPFRHNDPDSLREVLSGLEEKYTAFRNGTQSILVCVESIYSMDGNICPLQEVVDVVKELFPLGNAQIFMDEAHSSGVLGPKGSGLVQMLGLEKEIAIRVRLLIFDSYGNYQPAEFGDFCLPNCMLPHVTLLIHLITSFSLLFCLMNFKNSCVA